MTITIGDNTPIDAATLEGNDAAGQPISTAVQAALDAKPDQDTVYDDTAIQSEVDANTAKVGITPTQASDITSNNAKVSNVTTDLSVSRDSTTVTVESSDGTDAVLLAASATEAGLMTAADKVALDDASSGGGGGSSIIGDVQPLYVNTVDGLHINAAGEHWLESGFVSTDIATYPDAKQSSVGGGIYADNSFDVYSIGRERSGIAIGSSSRLYVTSLNNQTEFTRYNADGSSGVASTTTFAGYPRDLTSAGGEIYSAEYSGYIGHFDDTMGITTNYSISSTTGNIIGIAFDGIYTWVLGTNLTVYKFLNGAYQSESYDISAAIGDGWGITYDGANFYAVDTIALTVVQFDSSWNPTGESFDVSGQAIEPRGLEFDGTNFILIGTDGSVDQKAYYYGGYYPAVGIFSAETDTSTGLPIFVRIK